MLPANVTPIIFADSGFRTPFFRVMENLGWHWFGRIRNRDFIAWANLPNDWLAAKSLYAKATRKLKRLGSARWVRSHPLDSELVAFYQPANTWLPNIVQANPAPAVSMPNAKKSLGFWSYHPR